jgi:hypothetical protein
VKRRIEALGRKDLTPEAQFLRERAADLAARAASKDVSRYQFDRWESAVDGLLDAVEEIAKGDRGGDDDDDDYRRDRVARELERTYFRVTQADYFARLGRDPHGPEYVRIARQLYQTARAAFDRSSFVQARRLSEAARDTVKALEALAHASVPAPEPPVLK